MEAILIIIGGILTFLGGFVQQNIQNSKNQKKADKDLMAQAIDILLSIKRLKVTYHYERDFIEYADHLYHLSFRFQHKENVNIASAIRNFAKKRELARELAKGLSEDELPKEIDGLIKKESAGLIKTIEKRFEEEKK